MDSQAEALNELIMTHVLYLGVAINPPEDRDRTLAEANGRDDGFQATVKVGLINDDERIFIGLRGFPKPSKHETHPPLSIAKGVSRKRKKRFCFDFSFFTIIGSREATSLIRNVFATDTATTLSKRFRKLVFFTTRVLKTSLKLAIIVSG